MLSFIAVSVWKGSSQVEGIEVRMSECFVTRGLSIIAVDNCEASVYDPCYLCGYSPLSHLVSTDTLVLSDIIRSSQLLVYFMPSSVP